MTAANNDASPMDGAPVIDFDKFKPTRSFTSARKRKDFAMKALISCAFIVALIPLFSVLLTTIINGVKRLNLNFLSYNMTGVVGGNPTPFPPRPRPAATAASCTPSSARWKSPSAPCSSPSRSA